MRHTLLVFLATVAILLMLPARAAAATYTIYFDKSAENWQTVYTWVWDANDGDRNYTGGTWPGTQITAGANPEHPALYSYTFDCDNTNPKLMCIFSNQGSPQTKDLDLHDKWVYTKEGPRCHIDNYPGGGGGDFPVTNPTALGRMTGYDDEGGTVTVHAENGTLKITPWAPQIVRIFTLSSSAKVTEPRKSVNVVDKTDPYLTYEVPAADYSINETDDLLTVNIADGPQVSVNKQTCRVSFTEEGVLRLTEADGLVNSPAGGSSRVSFAPSASTEAFYGGGYNGQTIDHSGRSLYMDNKQTGGWNATYSAPFNICVPFVVSTAGYGLLFDSSHRGASISPSSNGTTFTCSSNTPIAYYYVGGATMERVMQNYTLLTGRQELPPFWALGYITSKFSFHSRNEAEEAVRLTKDAKLPLDGIVFDIHWQGQGGQGGYAMGHLDWDTSAYPNPEEMLTNFNKQGVHSVAITEPFFNSSGASADNYQELRSKGFLADEQVSNMGWMGGGANVGLIDVTNPEAAKWIGDKSAAMLDSEKGLSGIWMDLGEPEVHDGDSRHFSGSVDQVHNEFGNNWLEGVYRAVKDAQSQLSKAMRPMLLTRSGTAGMQRYASFPWSGDVQRSWDGLRAQVPALISASMSGIGYLGSDIGGFNNANTNDQMHYLRWVQLGVFYPMLRTHAQASLEPEAYKRTQVLNEVRDAINMRYAYLPYTYSQSYAYSAYGTPIARPSNFAEANPMEASALTNDVTAYYWGPDLFVAPMINEGSSRSISFPSGDWLDMTDWRTIYGGLSTINYNVPKAVLPHFMRRGSFVTRYRQDTFTNTASIDTDRLTIDYFCTKSAEPTGSVWYDDDHQGLDNIRQKQYVATTFTGHRNASDPEVLHISISREGYGWQGMNPTQDLLFQIHDYRTEPLTAASITLESADPAMQGMRTAASQEWTAASSLQELKSRDDNANRFFHDRNSGKLYLRLPALNPLADYRLTIGGNAPTAISAAAADLARVTLSYADGTFTYAAPAGCRDLELEIFTTLGASVATHGTLTADGRAHQLSTDLCAGVYIARLTATTLSGRETRTLKFAIR